jgi:arylsulfatase
MDWSASYWPRARFAEDRWELYDTRSDWTQARDVAAEHPELLAALQQQFLAEAARFGVLPLDDRMHERFDPATAPRPDLLGRRREITLRPGMRGLREGAAPNVKNTSFRMQAHLVVPEDDADGVLVAQGGRFAGWSVYVQDGRPVYCYNHCGRRTYIRGDEPIASGEHVLEVRFTYDGDGIGRGGLLSLSVDGTDCASGRIEATVGYQFSMDETLDVGCDRGTPVTEEYAAHPAGNRYAGRIRHVDLQLGDDQEQPSPADQERVVMATH